MARHRQSQGVEQAEQLEAGQIRLLFSISTGRNDRAIYLEHGMVFEKISSVEPDNERSLRRNTR